MKHSAVIVGVLAVILAMAEARSEAKRAVCACPRIYMPVCGSDHETYSNYCVLRCEAHSERGRAINLRKIADQACDNVYDFPVDY